jgi:hypothetical protein
MSKLHLVFGGRVTDPHDPGFRRSVETRHRRHLSGLYASAEDAWRSAAQKTVDDAEMRYVVVHLHRMLEPDLDA